MKFLFSICLLFHLHIYAQKDYTKLVNPMIGTGGHGHTYPGATSPFGMVQLSPDTRMADWDGSSGYHYSDSIIYGFSHTHLSGTGIPDYCDILFTPTVGDYEWDNKKYPSTFNHASEKAYAGFYGVHLNKHNINVKLTSTLRTGIHQYTFANTTTEGNIQIDLKHRDIVNDSYIEIVDAYTVKGYRFSKSWASNQKVFFVAKFNNPIIRKAIHISDATELFAANIAKGKAIQAGLTFDVSDGKPLLAQVAISPVSMDGAIKNLKAENVNFEFEKAVTNNVKLWNQELSKIDIESMPQHNVDTIFYSALYHMMVVPNLYMDVDGYYRGTNDKIYKAEGYTHYTVFSLWDTYRAYHPLMSIIDKNRTRDWIHTFLNQYKQGGMLPVWELSANETYCMIGYHSIPVIVDAYKKGVTDFDTKLALKAMLSYSKSAKFSIDKYAKQGFLSNDVEHESVSKTMEYAYDDWCIAEFANLIGEKKVATEYYQRSLHYRNLYNPNTGFFQGKIQGAWYTPFDPKEINGFYTEGNAWQYSLAAPHDVLGLKTLMGGDDNFTKHLETMFTTDNKTTGRDQADVTGLIGQYAHGNEPSHHMAYLFNYTKKPELAAYYVNKICKEFYSNTPDGLIGNEDCGQMSAWYVWSVLGMYPLNAAANHVVLGSPQVLNAKIKLNKNQFFNINVTDLNKNNYVINNVKLNSKNNDFYNVNNENFKSGNVFNFNMGINKSEQASFEFPGVRGNNFVTVPFIKKGEIKFKNYTYVELETINTTDNISYYIATNTNKDVSEKNIKYTPFYKPILLNNNSTLHFFAHNKNGQSSKIAQSFYKIPTDKTIEVLTKVNPMYTAGGNTALIDGIKGTANWQAGEWQSYYGNNLEAVIDLQKAKPIKKVSATLLQDSRSWIMMPRQMIVYGSNDNKKFEQLNYIEIVSDDKNETIKATDVSLSIKAANYRYIKVELVNYGKLPDWHLGAGYDSHLFVSEITIN
jgi:predicted alpha-1,2-mannosidase